MSLRNVNLKMRLHFLPATTMWRSDQKILYQKNFQKKSQQQRKLFFATAHSYFSHNTCLIKILSTTHMEQNKRKTQVYKQAGIIYYENRKRNKKQERSKHRMKKNEDPT